ncbi:hypothetical protein ACIQNI_34370 [Streptomyces sp. NPDC091266]
MARYARSSVASRLGPALWAAVIANYDLHESGMIGVVISGGGADLFTVTG